MRKGKQIIVFLLMGLAALAVVSCSSGNGEELMNFHAEIEWKIPDPALGERPRILFVGNSHTFYNNFSGMFVNIVEAKGKKSSVYELSQGYYTLKKFSDLEDKGGALLDKTLNKQAWDIVVLQENSQEALSETADEDMFPYARILDEKIRARGGQTAFFMTWAPRDGLKDGIKKRSREELQQIMAANYMEIADELGSLLIPAGIGFMRCAELYPEIELWDNDRRHPSPEGSYLAACTAYALLYQELPENCSYTATLEKDIAIKLQEIAADLILK